MYDGGRLKAGSKGECGVTALLKAIKDLGRE